MPGQKNYFPNEGAQFPGCQIIAGRFMVNGASAPTAIKPARNAKFTVSAPTTGVYTVTLSDGVLSGPVISAVAHLSDPLDGASTKRAFIGNVDNLSDGFADGFTITTQSTTGTAANLAAATECRVNFILIVSCSSLAVP